MYWTVPIGIVLISTHVLWKWSSTCSLSLNLFSTALHILGWNSPNNWLEEYKYCYKGMGPLMIMILEKCVQHLAPIIPYPLARSALLPQSESQHRLHGRSLSQRREVGSHLRSTQARAQLQRQGWHQLWLTLKNIHETALMFKDIPA